MNNTTSEIVLALDLAREILINYGSRAISTVGILVNIFGILILQNKRLQEKFYHCLFCRCFCNMVVCLFGSLHNGLPCMKCQGDYTLTGLQMYFYYPWTRIALIASIICDVLLILNRLLLLFDKRNNVFYTLSRKVKILPEISRAFLFNCFLKSLDLTFNFFQANLLICYSIAITFTVPWYFGVEVVKASNSTAETEGYWRLTAFGHHKHFEVYTLIALFMTSLLPTLLLILLNVVSMVRFKMVTRRMRPTSFLRRVEIQLVRSVLILNFICIFTRVFDLLISFQSRFAIFLGIQSLDVMRSFELLLNQVAIFCLFSAHALDGLFCHYNDRNLKQVACLMMRKPFRKLVEFFQGIFYTFKQESYKNLNVFFYVKFQLSDLN